MNLAKQIIKLKSKAKDYYLQATSLPYECGINLTRYISKSNKDAIINFNQTMDELAKIDPLTPSKRL